MTWLKGQTTWSTCVSDLTKLIAGEMADGVGTTAASGDKWVRPYVGSDYLQSPAASAVSLGNMSTRAGYWTLASVGTTMANPQNTVLKQTVCGTTVPGATRWVAIAHVVTQNTVSGNYSTALIQLQVYDLDTGSNITNSNWTPTASGDIVASTYIGTLNISDPSGFLSVSPSPYWTRCYTAAYPGGVDSFGPLYPKHTAAPTFSVSPPGASGTDYDVIELSGTGGTATPTNVATGAQQFSNAGTLLGGNLQGLGVKTNTFLTGALYTFTYSVALHSMHLSARGGANNGQIDLKWGGGYDNTNGRGYAHCYIAQWLRPYQIPGSVTSGSLLQYWISVKNDKVVIVLNADPGQSGKLTMAAMGTYTPQFATYDKFPVWCSSQVVDFTQNSSPQQYHVGWMKPNGQKRRQDGSALAVRDWQTGWLRGDFQVVNGSGFSNFFASTGTGNAQGDMDPGFIGMQGLQFTGITVDYQVSGWGGGSVPSRQPKPNPIDGNWWLYGYGVGLWSNGAANPPANMESLGPIGSVTDRVLFLPGDGWNSGDELTETSSGRVWFLVSPDFVALPARTRIATNSYLGGAAILEE